MTKWKLFLLMRGDLTGRVYNIFVCLWGPVNPMGTFLDPILERITELFEKLVVNKLLIGFRIVLFDHGGASCIVLRHHTCRSSCASIPCNTWWGCWRNQCYEQRKKALIPTPFNSRTALRIFLYFQKQELVEEDVPIRDSLLWRDNIIWVWTVVRSSLDPKPDWRTTAPWKPTIDAFPRFVYCR